MDSLTREDVYFTNLLEEGSNMSIDFILETPQAEVCTEQFPSETRLEFIAKKPTLGIKFIIEEDLLIVSAWLNTSIDPIAGISKNTIFIGRKFMSISRKRRHLALVVQQTL